MFALGYEVQSEIADEAGIHVIWIHRALRAAVETAASQLPSPPPLRR
jgi:hypothetical protein